MVKRYRVVLTSRSALRVDSKRVWKNADYELTLRNDLQENVSSDRPRHKGLICTVELQADNVLSSIREATAYAWYITDQLAVAHGVVIEYPEPHFSIDIDPECGNRELAQVLHDVPALYEPRRIHDDALYKPFHDRLEKLRQRDAKAAKRVDRALHYLRSSYLELNPFDRFEDAYIALEAMNPMVQKEYSLRTTRQRTCPNCKTGVFCRECNTEIHDSDGSSGIRHIVTEILQSSEDEAKKLREKRNSIVHGYAEFSSVFQDLNAMTELAQRAGIAGVLTVLGFPQQDIAGYLRGMLPLVGSRRAIVTAILYDLPIDLLKTGGKYPQLYLQYAEIAVPNRIETYRGELRPLASELHIGIRDFSGAWDLIELQVWPMIDPDDPASQTGVRATKVAES